MKKILALLLILVFAITLAGCGKEGDIENLVCGAEQHLDVDGLACVDDDPVCTDIQLLTDGECVDDPVCESGDSLVNHVCVLEDVLRSVVVDVEVCKNECSTVNSEFWGTYEETYLNYINSYYKLIAPNMDESSASELTDGFWDRSEIVRFDPISINYYFMLSNGVEELQHNLIKMWQLLLYCELGVECEVPPRYNLEKITDFDYGFNDFSGYYSYTATTDEGETLVSSFRFNFNDIYGNFEYYLFYPETESFEYERFHDGTYYKIDSLKDENTLVYTEINLDSKEIMDLTFNDTHGESMYYYDPLESLVYRYFSSTLFAIIEFENMELTASLSAYEYIDKSELNLSINFHFVEDWNKAEIYSSIPSLQHVNLMMDDTVVHDNYNVFLENQSDGYVYILGTITIPENEYQDFEFPTFYTGDRTFAELLTELEDFKSMEMPFLLAGISKDEIETEANKILEYLASNLD